MPAAPRLASRHRLRQLHWSCRCRSRRRPPPPGACGSVRPAHPHARRSAATRRRGRPATPRRARRRAATGLQRVVEGVAQPASPGGVPLRPQPSRRPRSRVDAPSMARRAWRRPCGPLGIDRIHGSVPVRNFIERQRRGRGRILAQSPPGHRHGQKKPQQKPPRPPRPRPPPADGAPGIDIGLSAGDRTADRRRPGHFLSDAFTLYLKTHNFHWNISGPMFSSLHGCSRPVHRAMDRAGRNRRAHARCYNAPAPIRFISWPSIMKRPDRCRRLARDGAPAGGRQRGGLPHRAQGAEDLRMTPATTRPWT